MQRGGLGRTSLKVTTLAAISITSLTSQLNVIISELSKLSIIQSNILLLSRSTEAQAWNKVHEKEDQAGTAEGVCEAGNGVSKLVCKLDVVLVDPAARNLTSAIKSGYVVGSEQTGHQVSNDSTNAVNGEHIECVVDVDQVLDLGCEVTGDGADDTEDDGGPGWDVTCCWGDGDESGDDAGAETDCRPLSVKSVIEENPGNPTSCSSGVGDEASHDCADVGSQRRSTVESEPADPKEHRAENDVCHVMWAVRKAVGGRIAGTLSEHKGVSQGSSARGLVDISMLNLSKRG